MLAGLRQRPGLRHPHHLAERDRPRHRGRRRRRRARRSGSRRQARQHPGHARRCAAGWRRRQCGGRSPQPAPRPGRGAPPPPTPEQQRQLDFQRQSQLQQAQTQQQIEDQKLFEEWKRAARRRCHAGCGNHPADVTEAQRLLTGLGYYRGPIDGVYGASTRSAIMQFESSQGLPRTGYLTPSLVQSMRAAI